MADFYPYLIPSLPMLHFGMKPPFSFEQFLDICRQQIPDTDYQILCNLPQPQQYTRKGKRQKTLMKWMDFDTDLRNELVKVRAHSIHAEPSTFLRQGISADSSLTAVATAAMGNTSLLDAEVALDEVRWNALEQLARGHYFDLDLLIIYAYKLLILIRWKNAHDADPARMVEQVLQTIRG